MKLLKKITTCFREQEFTVADWLLYGIITALCFTFFTHPDVLITAQHATALLKGNITEFYSACHEWNNTYGANYMPSTFFVFALWNIPFKLLSLLPEAWGVWPLSFSYWNKLLPILFWVLSIWLLGKICVECFKMSREKAQMVRILFVTSYFGFFSQFIFCQYDVFTVFFMLLGLYYYFKEEQTKRTKLLCLLFLGIAATFKYFVLVIIAVLVVLRYKKVGRILSCMIGGCVPLVLEAAFYLLFDQESFLEAVFGFSVLGNANISAIDIGYATINLLPLFLCLIIAAAFFTKINSREEEMRYAIYYCTGVVAVIFSLLSWHPQWLIFAVPFWTLALAINKRFDVLIWLDTGAAVIFNVFTSLAFADNVDQRLFKYGILKGKLYYKAAAEYTMADVYHFTDKNMLYTILVVVFIIYFIFSHPKYQMEDWNMPIKKVKGLIRMRFLVAILSFLIPAFAVLPGYLNGVDTLWKQNATEHYGKIGMSDGTVVKQNMTLYGDTLDSVSLGVAGTIDNKTKIVLTLIDDKGDTVVTKTLKGQDRDEDSGKYEFEFDDLAITRGMKYQLELHVVTAKGAEEDDDVSIWMGNDVNNTIEYLNVRQQDYENEELFVNGEQMYGLRLMTTVCGHVYE